MDIAELLSSFSDEDMQRLKETAQNLLSSGNAAAPAAPAAPPNPLASIDPRLLNGIGKVAGMINRPDPRCDFLLALKPLLGKERQGRVDEAVQMLRMISMLPRVMEMGGQSQ